MQAQPWARSQSTVTVNTEDSWAGAPEVGRSPQQVEKRGPFPTQALHLTQKLISYIGLKRL